MVVTFVSSNEAKRDFWRAVAADEGYGIAVMPAVVDIPEIQDSVQRIAEQKARDAYHIYQKPVIVEDVSLGIVKWDLAPGPYIKYWRNAHLPDKAPAVFTVAATFYDGSAMFTEYAHTMGVIAQGQGDVGAGFNPVFWPDGAPSTLGNMTAADERKWSPRTKAAKALFASITASKQ